VRGTVDEVIPVDVNVPGCPPRPQAILEGVAKAMEIWKTRI
jgi:Ni,Fe-hydrogenase III small subunit